MLEERVKETTSKVGVCVCVSVRLLGSFTKSRRWLDEVLLLLLSHPRPFQVLWLLYNVRHTSETPNLTTSAKYSSPLSQPQRPPYDHLFALTSLPALSRTTNRLVPTNKVISEHYNRPFSLLAPNMEQKQVDVWLDRADRFKNGAIPREAVKTVIRDALLLNGLPSPRESDVRLSLQHTSTDSQGLHFDRRKLGVELKHLIRNSLRTEYKE